MVAKPLLVEGLVFAILLQFSQGLIQFSLQGGVLLTHDHAHRVSRQEFRQVDRGGGNFRLLRQDVVRDRLVVQNRWRAQEWLRQRG